MDISNLLTHLQDRDAKHAGTQKLSATDSHSLAPRCDRSGFVAVGTSVPMCVTNLPTGTDIVIATANEVLFTTGLSSGIAVATLSDYNTATHMYDRRAMIHLRAGDYGPAQNSFVDALAQAMHPSLHLVIAFGLEYESDYLTSTAWGPAFLVALSSAMQALEKGAPTSMQMVFPRVVPAGQERGSLAVAPDGRFGFLRVPENV